MKNKIYLTFLIFIVGCMSNIEKPAAAPSTAAYTLTPSITPTTITLAEINEPELTVSGTVMEVSFSAKVIFLLEPVKGVTTIALSKTSKLASENGDEISMHDIYKGDTIQAFGQPGDSNSLLANKVIVLNEPQNQTP